MCDLTRAGWLLGRDSGVRPLQEAYGSQAFARALPTIMPSDRPTAKDLRRLHASHLLCCASELNTQKIATRGGCYAYGKIPLRDAPNTVPPAAYFLAAWTFAQDARARCLAEATPLRIVAHCASGKHRSPAVACFLLAGFSGTSIELSWKMLVASYPAAERVQSYLDAAEKALAQIQAGVAGDGDAGDGTGTGRPTRT